MLCSHLLCEHPLPLVPLRQDPRPCDEGYNTPSQYDPSDPLKMRSWSVWSIPYQYVSLWCCSTLGLFAVEGEGYLPPLLERQDIVLHASVITIGYLQRCPDLSADVFLN